MNRIYQWLSGRASFFRSDTSGRGANRTLRTEVTVERQGMTLLVGGVAAGFDTCPLCGQTLAPTKAEVGEAPPLTGSTAQDFPVVPKQADPKTEFKA